MMGGGRDETIRSNGGSRLWWDEEENLEEGGLRDVRNGGC